MVEVNRIRVFGWLPAGLVLNTRLDTKLDKPILVPQLAQSSSESSRALVPVGQASDATMYRLRGEFRSPVILADIASHEAAPFQESNLGDCEGYINIDPYSQACMLMNSALFEGELVSFQGSDCPMVSIDAQHLDPQACLTLRDAESHEQAYEVCFRCSVFIPERAATQGVYGMDKNSQQAYCAGVRGFQVKLLADDDIQADLYGGWTMIAALNEFRMSVRSAMGMKVAYREDASSGASTYYSLPTMVSAANADFVGASIFASIDLNHSQRVFGVDTTTHTVADSEGVEAGNSILWALHVNQDEGEILLEDSTLLGVAELPLAMETTVEL